MKICIEVARDPIRYYLVPTSLVPPPIFLCTEVGMYIGGRVLLDIFPQGTTLLFKYYGHLLRGS